MTSIARFGSKGTIGTLVLSEALRRGHSVTAIVRDPAGLTAQTALTVTVGDVLDIDKVA